MCGSLRVSSHRVRLLSHKPKHKDTDESRLKHTVYVLLYCLYVLKLLEKCQRRHHLYSICGGVRMSRYLLKNHYEPKVEMLWHRTTSPNQICEIHQKSIQLRNSSLVLPVCLCVCNNPQCTMWLLYEVKATWAKPVAPVSGSLQW